MTGILIVDKPTDFTSFDVVAKLRGICGTKRIGHSGTLDPMATGVLPVFIGDATKAVDMQKRHDKTYVATLLLGKKTDTGDITGEVTQQKAVPDNMDEETINSIIPQFLGEGMQLPPMYSAVKINGRPLYKAARQGIEVERQPRPIVVHSITYMGACGENEHKFTIHCGKGTYVRVLLEDIANALGTVGTMADLRRTTAGVYTLQGAKTLKEIQSAKDSGTLESLLLSIDTVFDDLPSLNVNDEVFKRLLNGAPTYKFYEKDGTYKAYKKDGSFIGVCTVQDNTLHIKKIFCGR